MISDRPTEADDRAVPGHWEGNCMIGKEMSHHAEFTVDTGVQVQFCDLHSPQQRASNENANGLLRQYYPHVTDFSTSDAARLQEVEVGLNRRPRKTLDWNSPTEAYAATVAMIE